MIEKLKSELLKKYSGQTTRDYLENLAGRLAEKIEKEEDIQGVIDELDSSPVKIGDLQTEGDRRVAKLKKELEELKKKKAEPAPLPPPDPGSDVSREIAELKKAIDQERRERRKQEARAKLMERVKDKQIPRALIDDVVIDSVDEVDDAVQRLQEKAEAIRKEIGTPSQEQPKKGDPVQTSQKQVIEDLEKFKPR